MSKPVRPNIPAHLRSAVRKLLVSRRKIDPETRCWLWQRKLVKGYGTVSFRGKVYFVHRLSWNAWRGDIPEGRTIDHLCKNRACFNPKHIEPVSNLINNRRAHGGTAPETACIKGHEFTDATSYVNKHGRRICRTCEAQRSRDRRKRGELWTWDKTRKKTTPAWERKIALLRKYQAENAKYLAEQRARATGP